MQDNLFAKKLSTTIIILLTAIGIVILFVVNDTTSPVLSEQDIHNDSVMAFDTPYIKEYSLPNGTGPNAILVDKNEMVWTVGSTLHILFKFDPTKKLVYSYPIIEKLGDKEASRPLMSWTMLQDNDGFIWFSRLGENKIWRFDPVSEKFSAFHSSAGAFQMKLDNDTGNIWFVTLAGNTIGVIQKDAKTDQYKITEFNVKNGNSPTSLFVKNNHGWITQFQINNTSKSAGEIVEFYADPDKNIFNISGKIPGHVYLPTDVIGDGNDSIWFTEHGTSTIAKYQVNSSDFKRFATSSNQYQAKTLPFWIRTSLDGNGLWFNEHEGKRISYLDKRNMTLTEFEIPSRPLGGEAVYPFNIALDPTNNNRLWFSEWNTDKIGMVDRSVTVPFDINTDARKIVERENNLENKSMLYVTVTKKFSSWSGNSSNIVYLNATTAPDPLTGYTNMTMEFSPSVLDLTKIDKTASDILYVKKNPDESFNSTLIISASDGIVTKSIFLDLDVNYTKNNSQK